MHELSIALSILDVAEEQAKQQSFSEVTAIHLKVGPLSGVIREALISAFELARENTPFAKCVLEIEDVPIVGYCQKCGKEQPAVSEQEICCAECGTPMEKIIHGRELEITAMEVCDDDENKAG